MSSSDGDYVADDMSDQEQEHIVSHHGTRSTGPVRGAPPGSSTRGGDTHSSAMSSRPPKKAAWEDIQRSWDKVVESADGSINSAVSELRDASKRRRLLKDTTPLQRGIIRHLVLVLDLSFAMVEKDMRPTRYLLMIRYAGEFVTEFFEQNPISQLGIIGMRDGIAIRISDMSGNPTEHLEKLRGIREAQGQGNPSLQNALEMCRAALFHAPSHGTREVLIIYGALLSSDPGDIHTTIADLVKDKIRVSVVGLAAHLEICNALCVKTNAGGEGNYNVALNEQHFRELFFALTTPPVTRSVKQSESSLLMMGFPSRTTAAASHTATSVSTSSTIQKKTIIAAKSTKTQSLCACHSKLTRGGYLCTRCESKVCSLPAECPSCGLTLILSTHLARSYHHLFPLRNWVEVPWSKADSKMCGGCLVVFPVKPAGGGGGVGAIGVKGKGHEGVGKVANGEVVETEAKGISESGRYACEVCGGHFCIDCDVFAHEVVHNCPGCQSDTRDPTTIITTTTTRKQIDTGDPMIE